EYRLRKRWRDANRWILILESMPEDEVVSLGSVLPEVLVDFSRRLRLHVRDARAERVPDRQKAFISASVPTLIRDRPRRDQCDFERIGSRLRLLPAPSASHYRDCEQAVDNCGQPWCTGVCKRVKPFHDNELPFLLITV